MDVFSSILAVIKALFPSIVGSFIAVWKRGSVKSLSEFSRKELFQFICMSIFLVIVGISLGEIVGGAVVAYKQWTAIEFIFLAKLVVAICGLKLVDITIKAADDVSDAVGKNLPVLVSVFFETLIDKIKRFFKG